jgi:hypothetical protein
MIAMAALVLAVLAAPASALRWLDVSPPPVVTVPADFSVEATGPDGAVVTFSVSATDDPDGSLPVACTTDSGSTLSLGSHVIDCSATDSDGQTSSSSFTVTVQDTTPPVFDPLPSPTGSTATATATVTWSNVTATDVVTGSRTATCTPGSGSDFAIGTTHVACDADDGDGNVAHSGFDVVVSDSGPPSISVDVPGPTEATGTTTSVSYTIHASDNSGSVNVTCDHPSGSAFAVTTTHTSCTATDPTGNHASTEFDIVVQDTTPPSLALPADITVEADSSSGKAVTYSASASDLVSGPVTPNCSPASGSTFPVGATTVNCTATDGHNQSSGSFKVTVTDASGPAFSSVPSTIVSEANGPGGAVVNYTTPTAVDTVDGPQLVSCSPASHSLFPLGSTAVHCTAADNHGNSSSTSFQVSVVDRTPPTLAIPGPTTVYATTPTGIPETAPAFFAFRNAASAADIVDPHPQISDNLGSFAEIGVHDVGFVAHDASGNVTTKSTTFTVLPQPPPGTTPLPPAPPAKLPGDVQGLKITTGSGFVRLAWGAVAGAAQYLVYRAETGAGARRLTDVHGDLVYKGAATTYTDRGLTNGVEYRYVVVSEDAAGNQSAGVAASAVPKLNLLRTPKDGAKLKKPPKFVWARNAEASYYNLQLFRGQAKILSTWPVAPSFQLKRTWKYLGKKYTLGKGVYRWYVWPGFGARAKVDYGDLLGSNSFQMTR